MSSDERVSTAPTSSPGTAAGNSSRPGSAGDASGSIPGAWQYDGAAGRESGVAERPDGALSESVTATGSKYKSSFTKSLAEQGSLYPTGSASGRPESPGATSGRRPGGSPALDEPAGPGPATSLGLGSATTTSARAAGVTPVTSIRRRPAAGPRRAKLQIRHIDPWSTLKLSLVLAVAFFFVWMVAVGILYGVLSAMGVFSSIDSTFSEFGGSGGSVVTPKLVFGGAALIGAINIVLFTALATIGAYVYNLCADLAGGLEITLAERR